VSQRVYLLDASVILPLVRGNHPSVIDAYVEVDLVSQNHPDGARNMGKNDLWIAACARAAGATLLTADNDFTHLIPDHLDGEVIDPAIGRSDDSE